MAAVRILGRPHSLVTMIYNPNYEEIKSTIPEWDATAVHCPGVVNRVFKLKLEEPLADIM